MPKIEAASVAAHRELMSGRLLDAAEEILRTEGLAGLTAAAVGERAGVARNSIYRYVTTVDELVSQVIARRMAPWFASVERQVADVADPVDYLVAWTTAHLIEAADGHAWLMALATATMGADAGGKSASSRAADAKVHAHARADEGLLAGLRRLGSPDPATHAALVRGLLDAGFRLLNAGRDSQTVIAEVSAAVRAYALHVRETSQP